MILLIPASSQANDVHRARGSARTTQAAEGPFDVFDASLAGHRHCKRGFERRYSHRVCRETISFFGVEGLLKLCD